jgi:hypothetical protein
MNAWRDPRVDAAIQGFQELLNLADRRLRRYAYVVEIQTTRLDSPVVWPPKARMSGMPYRLTTPGARGQVDGCAGGDARHVAGRVAAVPNCGGVIGQGLWQRCRLRRRLQIGELT